jgi:hypothetical protein
MAAGTQPEVLTLEDLLKISKRKRGLDQLLATNPGEFGDQSRSGPFGNQSLVFGGGDTFEKDPTAARVADLGRLALLAGLNKDKLAGLFGGGGGDLNSLLKKANFKFPSMKGQF